MKKVCFLFILVFAFSCSQKKENIAVNNYAWVNDSLNMEVEGLRKSGRWIDTVKTNCAFALYQSDTLNIMRTLILRTRGTIDSEVKLSDWKDGELEISPVDPFEVDGEYFIVKQGLLWLYNKEGKSFASARQLSSNH